MHIKPAIGLVVGPVNETHWGQVLTTPSAYAIVEIEDVTRHAQDAGVRILSRLGELLQAQLTSLKALEEVANRVIDPSVKTLVLLVPVGSVVYLVVRGKGSVYIKRGGELASLLHQDGAVSGEVKQHDTILLASNGFSSVLTREELTGLFDHLPPIEIAEKLTLILHEKSGGEGSVAFVFGVQEFDVSQPPASVETLPTESKIPTHASPGVHGIQHAIEVFRGFFSKDSVHRLVSRVRNHPKIFIAASTFFFILLFALSVFLGIQKQVSSRKNMQLTAAIRDAQHALDEGVALLDLNPVKGRERLHEGKDRLEPLLQTVSDRTIEGRQVALLYQKITDNLTLAMHVTTVQPTLFYDVSLLKKNASASHIARDGTSLYISDAVTNTVYGMDVTTKNAYILGGGDMVKRVSYISAHGGGVYVLSDDGIVQLQRNEKKPKLVVKKDDVWGSITGLVTFGGNLYLLDTQKSRIWKYIALEKGFSETREYLNPDTLPDLSRSTGMSIDGSIYLGTATGLIFRFTQGKENTFQSKGVDPVFGATLFVYSSDDTKNMYVLDSKNNRIVLLDKDGTYISQYQYTGVQSPTSMVVFEAEKKIILLSGGKLYTVDLK